MSKKIKLNSSAACAMKYLNIMQNCSRCGRRRGLGGRGRTKNSSEHFFEPLKEGSGTPEVQAVRDVGQFLKDVNPENPFPENPRYFFINKNFVSEIFTEYPPFPFEGDWYCVQGTKGEGGRVTLVFAFHYIGRNIPIKWVCSEADFIEGIKQRYIKMAQTDEFCNRQFSAHIYQMDKEWHLSHGMGHYTYKFSEKAKFLIGKDRVTGVPVDFDDPVKNVMCTIDTIEMDTGEGGLSWIPAFLHCSTIINGTAKTFRIYTGEGPRPPGAITPDVISPNAGFKPFVASQAA